MTTTAKDDGLVNGLHGFNQPLPAIHHNNSKRNRELKQPMPRGSFIQLLYRQLENLLSFISTQITQAYRGARRNTFQYLLGCGSVFLVVFIVSVLLTAISYAPAVFLSLAESEAGELDFQLYAGDWSPYSRLNYTLVKDILKDRARYSVSRIYKDDTGVFDVSKCLGYRADAPDDNTFTYQGPPVDTTKPLISQTLTNSSRAYCQSVDGYSCAVRLCQKPGDATVLFVDTLRERELRIGRAWPFDPIPAGKCLVHQNLARAMSLSIGDYMLFALGYDDWFHEPYEIARNVTGLNGVNMETVNMVVQIHDIIPSNFGKQPLGNGKTIFMELGHALEMVTRFARPPFNIPFNESSSSGDSSLLHSVTDVLFNCDGHRVSCYMDTNYERIAKRIVDWASSIVFALDYTQLDSRMPVLKELEGTQLVNAFLNLIFSLVIVMMGGLSIFLIYSLLMVSVETRTFEMGVFRMIGLTKNGLVLMIMIQALMYAVPGWGLGLLGGQLTWIFVRGILETLLKTDIGAFLVPSAISTSTVIGLVVPIFAAVLPIKKALSQNLHDALDTRRSKTKAVVMTVERTRGQSVSPMLLSIGLVLTVLGFLVYYLLPLSLLYNDVALLFNIFLVVLIGLMLGLVMLSMNLQPVFERVLVSLLFSTVLRWERPSMPKLIVKNLIAHRLRNSKTSTMYATALGFIIFLTVSIRIELQSLMYVEMRDFVSDIRIRDSYYGRDGLYSYGIRNNLRFESFCEESPFIDSFTHRTFYHEDIDYRLLNSKISNIGRTKSASTAMVGLAPNYYDVADEEYTHLEEQDTTLNQAYSLTEALYLPEAFGKAHVATLYRSELHLNASGSQLLHRYDTEIREGFKVTNTTVLTVAAFMNSAPGIDFSAFPARKTLDVAVGYPFMLRMFGGGIKSMEDLPVAEINIKLKSSVTGTDVENVMADLSRIATGEEISNIDFELAGIRTADATLSYIFQIVTIAVMVVSFFSLNSSMVTNIMEQKMEIGVLRALGLRKPAIFRLFAYEAFFLVLSASVLGTMIGIVSGWSMALQRSVITEVPLRFIFPFDIFLVVVVSSIICAFLSTVAPVLKLVYRTAVISLIRG
eukprot:Partr_v1_DN28816_c1_g1_i1_m33460 putative FtsX-like permease family